MRAPLPVEVVRSTRRRKTVQAVLTDGVIRVHVPARMSDREVEDYIAELVPRLERRARSDHIDLELRASKLAKRFRLPMPESIEWAENQRRRWGSCQPSSGRIRISAQLAECPPWVLDYVIVHELTHLVHADHSPAFTALVDRYPRAERARGYLLAKGERMAAPDAPPIDVDLDVDVDLYADEIDDLPTDLESGPLEPFDGLDSFDRAEAALAALVAPGAADDAPDQLAPVYEPDSFDRAEAALAALVAQPGPPAVDDMLAVVPRLDDGTLDLDALDRAYAYVERAQRQIAERETHGQGQLPLG